MSGLEYGAGIGGALGSIFHQVCFRAGTQVLVSATQQKECADDDFHSAISDCGTATATLPKLKLKYLTRNVEDMREGDALNSLNENDPTGEPTTSYIEEVHVSTAYHLQIVTLLSSNGIVQRIDTTGEHPAQLLGKGWVASRKFKPGDLIQERGGGYSLVLSSVAGGASRRDHGI